MSATELGFDVLAPLRERVNGNGHAEGNPFEPDVPFGEPDWIGEELPPPQHAQHLIDGAAFVFDEPEQVPALWGSSEQPGWAAGEGLMIVGPQGVGKTTLMQQLTLARVGLREHVLGMPVERDSLPVLYIAADRPRQAARSLRRMVTVDDAEALRERLQIWKGPLPFLLTDRDGPERFRDFLLEREIGSVFIDSLKDVAAKITEDEGGSRINFALQTAIAEGIETCVGHHQRKASAENKRPNKLADVYGSNWITAGQGSVMLLWGEAGDPLVRLDHLKQPLGELGPFDVAHDHERGVSRLHEPPELTAMLHDRGSEGLTVAEAAEALYGSSPSKAQIEKARRLLKKQPLALLVEGVLGAPERYVYNGPKNSSEEWAA
jgi:replicative DNA helicase